MVLLFDFDYTTAFLHTPKNFNYKFHINKIKKMLVRLD